MPTLGHFNPIMSCIRALTSAFDISGFVSVNYQEDGTIYCACTTVWSYVSFGSLRTKLIAIALIFDDCSGGNERKI